MELHASQSSVGEALATLQTATHVKIVATGDLNGAVEGTYRGCLRRVLKSMLRDRNYVLTRSGGRIDVTLVGAPTAGVQTQVPRRPPSSSRAMSLSRSIRARPR